MGRSDNRLPCKLLNFGDRLVKAGTNVPATAVLLSTIAIFLGYGAIEGGLPLKVVIILSSMPVAFSALIPVSIYDLNLDLANSCWLVTTLSLIVILPLLFYIISLI